MEAVKPKTAVQTLITANERRIEAVEDALRNTPNLVMPEQLKEDICALIVSIREYNSFLKDIYDSTPAESDNWH